MIKKRSLVIFVSLACAILAIGAICFFGVKSHLDNKITFTVNDTLCDGGGREATVILLGGQSNASGCSLDEYLKRNVTPEKYEEYKVGYENVYINYLSGANVSGGFVKCATLQGELSGAFGPELGLAEKLSELYPDKTFFIIKCAWGGSNLHKQWLSPSSFGKTGELYKEFVAYVEASMDYLISKNYNAKIAGMCWMQGESDAVSRDAAEDYGKNLNNLIKDIRKKFSKYSADGGIAFADAYIAPNPTFWVHYEAVNRAKDEVAASSPKNVIVDTISAGLICTEEPENNPDIPHYDSMSEIKLGHLFAEALSAFFE
ncbi:MAG: hypothetical protein IJW66_03230 [Clostridia bacterium]|nr:hypothetical protein [Clostridia bacterium]